ELSTTIACNANRERMLVDKVSTADAIAVPHLKMSLEMDRREYRHAPVLNLMTRGMEEGRTVIFGREVELGSEDIAEEVIVACLERWPKTSIVVMNSPVTRPLLAVVDEEAVRRLKKNEWDRSALMNVMKDVDPRMQRIFKACVIAWITTSLSYPILRTMIWNLMVGDTWDAHLLRVIFWMWDYELWRPLPDDVEWRSMRRNGVECACRMKRFRAKPGYKEHGKSSEWLWLEVDENGDVLDTRGNYQLKEWIQEEPIKEPKSRLSKFLQKLNV
ncbi:hypothetical protein FRC17_006965, partial [Serendipita sp. 399]